MDLTWIQQLPETQRLLLFGSAGNYFGGLAAHATAKLLEAAGAGIRKKFRPEPREKALNIAFGQALNETFKSFTLDDATFKHLCTFFQEWLAREDVVIELVKLIEPHKDSKINLEVLKHEFEDLGYSPDYLGEDIRFESLVLRFADEFKNAAAKQPELQEHIKISLLKDIVEQLQLIVDS